MGDAVNEDHPGESASVYKSNKASANVSSLPEKIVSTSAELDACCEELSRCRRLGMDTEFVGEETYHPRLCLVQVATEKELFLIDPQSVGSLTPFWQVITDPANLVIVHAGREEIRLCKLWSGEAPANIFDLQIAAGLHGLAYPMSHANLVQVLLGVRLAKAETLTEWRNRPLSRAQIQYAFDDVRYLIPLWERISTALDDLGRMSWAREEFDRLKQNAMPLDRTEANTNEKWRKLRGAGTLDRRQLAVLRDLYYWREDTAAQMNRPARTVMRDDLLVEIARRSPRRTKDVQVMRGVPRKSCDAILAVVENARQLELEQCPTVFSREQDPPQVALILHILSAVLADFCAKKRLAANLVAGNQDLKQLASCFFKGQEVPKDWLLNQGWRKEHILPHLLAVLEGKISIQIGDIRSIAPLRYQ